VIVLDTSAAVHCVVATRRDPALLARVAEAGTIHVPHLIDAEVLSALRGLALSRMLSDDRARDAWTDFDNLRLLRYPMSGFAERVWRLRHRMTAYDAAFVALAEALRLPLVTCDRKLAQAAPDDASVEVYEPRAD
jgi:predicted nucleic acid-binding protein